MTGDRLTLFVDAFWISPYVFSCFVALREKGLPFEATVVSLRDGEHRLPPYRDRTLTAKVPALAHEDFWLAESSAVVEYLEDVFAPPDWPAVLPRDVRHRARARQVMAWIRSDLPALREERSTTTMFYDRAERPLTDAGRKAADTLVRVSEALVPSGESFLFGDFGVADADLAFMLHRLILNGHEVPARVRAFAERVWQRACVREFVDRPRAPFEPYG